MKKQPYEYLIIRHGGNQDTEVYKQGITVAETAYDAYRNIGNSLIDTNDQDAEQLEVYIRTYIKDDSCPTKKDFGGIYAFLLDNNIMYYKNSTASYDDFTPNTFTNESNYNVPNSMYLIDIFNLIKNDKKNLI